MTHIPSLYSVLFSLNLRHAAASSLPHNSVFIWEFCRCCAASNFSLLTAFAERCHPCKLPASFVDSILWCHAASAFNSTRTACARLQSVFSLGSTTWRSTHQSKCRGSALGLHSALYPPVLCSLHCIGEALSYHKLLVSFGIFVVATQHPNFLILTTFANCCHPCKLPASLGDSIWCHAASTFNSTRTVCLRL
jgi:hypothetical protein